MHKPKYNTEFNTTDCLTITLPNLKWIDKDDYINIIKTEKISLKNSFDYIYNKANNRKNKVKGYSEFFLWIDNWEGKLTKVNQIKEFCKINDKQWECLKRHTAIKSILDTLQQPQKGYYSR